MHDKIKNTLRKSNSEANEAEAEVRS